MNKREQGALFEEYAARFLSEQGYMIVTKIILQNSVR